MNPTAADAERAAEPSDWAVSTQTITAAEAVVDRPTVRPRPPGLSSVAFETDARRRRLISFPPPPKPISPTVLRDAPRRYPLAALTPSPPPSRSPSPHLHLKPRERNRSHSDSTRPPAGPTGARSASPHKASAPHKPASAASGSARLRSLFSLAHGGAGERHADSISNVSRTALPLSLTAPRLARPRLHRPREGARRVERRFAARSPVSRWRKRRKKWAASVRESVCVLQAIKFVLQVLHAHLPPASPACLPSAGNSHAPRLRTASTAVCLLHVISECVCVCEGERERGRERPRRKAGKSSFAWWRCCRSLLLSAAPAMPYAVQSPGGRSLQVDM